jgi:hypothetical protein
MRRYANTVLALSERSLEVMGLGTQGWFRDHATHSLTCGCSIVEPDKECDLGWALHRLATRKQESAPVVMHR